MRAVANGTREDQIDREFPARWKIPDELIKPGRSEPDSQSSSGHSRSSNNTIPTGVF